jgi:hypothetical protein
VLLLVGVAIPSRAQVSSLTISPGTVTFATPTVADYNLGYLCAGTVGYSVTATTNTYRTDTLFVRATATSIPSDVAGVTKVIGDLQFNTSTVGCGATTGWAPVPPSTAAPARVWSARIRNTTVSGSVYFRLLLTWTTDRGGATYTLPDLRFFLNRSQTVPPLP